eukprot:gene19146-22931_t
MIYYQFQVLQYTVCLGAILRSVSNESADLRIIRGVIFWRREKPKSKKPLTTIDQRIAPSSKDSQTHTTHYYIVKSLVTSNEYQLFSEPGPAVNNADAITACNVDGGYLATITTAAEAADVIQLLGLVDSSPMVWVSGVGNSGSAPNSELTSWSYSTGSPQTVPFYTYMPESCTTYCPWGPKEPTFNSNKGQTAIVMGVRQAKFQGAIFDNVLSSNNYGYICEYSQGIEVTEVIEKYDGETRTILYTVEIGTADQDIKDQIATITNLNDPTATYTSQIYQDSPVFLIRLKAPFTGVYSLSFSSSTNVAYNTIFQFKNESEKTFLKRMVVTVDTTYGNYMVYSGARYNPADSNYYYKYGPQKDDVVSFHSDFKPDDNPSLSATDTFVLPINNANNKLQLPPGGTDIGLYMQVKYNQIIPFPTEVQMLNTDGFFEFGITEYGHIFAKVILHQGSESPEIRDVTTPDLSFPTGKVVYVPGYGSGTETWDLMIDGFAAATVTIGYNPPTLDDSSVPQVTTAGLSQVTLTGTNFFNDIGVTSLLIDGNQVTPSSATYTSIVVDIPEISGNTPLVLSIQVDDQISNSVTLTYQGPIIVSCPSAISPIGGEVIVEGTSFGNDVGNIYLDGHPDVVITILEAHTKISFVVPEGTGVFTFSLVVYGQSSQPRTIDYSGTQEPLIINSFTSVEFNKASHITIDGENFLGGHAPVVSIGGLDCPVVTSSDSQIICDFAANVPINLDGDALLVNVTLGSLSAVSYTFYYKQDYTCPLDCGSNDNHIAVPLPNISKPGSMVDVPGSESISYSIGIQHIREISPLGEIVRQINMSSAVWSVNTSTPSSANYHETMPIVFAGEPLTMAPYSVKQVITLKDYVFINQANRLEIIFATQQNGTTSSNHTTNTGSQDPTNLVWYDISTDESILTSRFSRRMIVDNRYTRNRVSIIPLNDTLYASGAHDSTRSILTAMTVPHHLNEVTLDPNFALLLRGKSSSSTEESSGGKKIGWKIPVIVVCSVVGALAISIAVVFVIKRRLQGRRFTDVAMRALRSQPLR